MGVSLFGEGSVTGHRSGIGYGFGFGRRDTFKANGASSPRAQIRGLDRTVTSVMTARHHPLREARRPSSLSSERTFFVASSLFATANNWDHGQGTITRASRADEEVYWARPKKLETRNSWSAEDLSLRHPIWESSHTDSSSFGGPNAHAGVSNLRHPHTGRG